jgi:hypothetical protein
VETPVSTISNVRTVCRCTSWTQRNPADTTCLPGLRYPHASRLLHGLLVILVALAIWSRLTAILISFLALSGVLLVVAGLEDVGRFGDWYSFHVLTPIGVLAVGLGVGMLAITVYANR